MNPCHSVNWMMIERSVKVTEWHSYTIQSDLVYFQSPFGWLNGTISLCVTFFICKYAIHSKTIWFLIVIFDLFKVDLFQEQIFILHNAFLFEEVNLLHRIGNQDGWAFKLPRTQFIKREERKFRITILRYADVSNLAPLVCSKINTMQWPFSKYPKEFLTVVMIMFIFNVFVLFHNSVLIFSYQHNSCI